jgi:hypothetical protein
MNITKSGVYKYEKNMKMKGLLSILLVSIAQIAFGGEKFNLKEEFSKRELLVLKYDAELDVIAEFKESGDTEGLKKYESEINRVNENLENGFKEFWSTKQQSSMTWKSAVGLTEVDLLKYSVLSSGIEVVEKIEFFVFTLNTVYAEVKKNGKKVYKIHKKTFKINIQNTVPSMADILFLTTKMKMYFGEKNVFDQTKLEELLASKTLLLHQDGLKIKEGFDIGEFYKFPFKISTTKEIFELAEKRDNKSLYIKLDVEYKGDMAVINFMIIDCESGEIVSRCNLGGLGKVTVNLPSNRHLMNQSFVHTNGSSVSVFPYSGTGYGHVGQVITTLYTKKAKLQKVQFKVMSSQSTQIKRHSKTGLMIY